MEMAELTAAAEQYLALRNERDEAQKLTEDRQTQMNALQEQILTGIAVSGLQRFSAHGFTFAPRMETFYSVPADQKDQLLAAMANNANFAGIVNPGYNANSLRSRVKEILDRADEFQQGDAESREAGSAALQIIERLKKTETPKLSVVSSGKK